MRKPKSKWTVIVIRPLNAPVVEQIDADLDGLYSVVGEPVDALQLEEIPIPGYDLLVGGGYDLWCNDEGLVNGMSPNRMVPHPHLGEVPIHGACLIARHDGEGNTVSLTEADLARWMRRAAGWPMIATPLPAPTLSSLYPRDWPDCPGCGRPALDGHITCGEAACDEGGRR